MTNKLESSSSSSLLEKKIMVLLEDLNKDFANLESATKEDVIITFNEVVKKFYRTIDSPIFEYKEIQRGKIPSIKDINNSFKKVEQDLRVIYLELLNIREQMASNFNALSSKTLKIKSDIAKSYSDISDYKIQNDNRITPTFSDMFNDSSKIESDDSFYDKDKAFIDTKNNRVILPLQGEAESFKIKKISIGESSVGTSGNNQEVGAVARDNLQLLADGSVDTWFEFEQVSNEEIKNPTVLFLKMEFSEEKIFNLLDIASVPFPTGGYPAISQIEGSIDGSLFFDLMPYYLGEMDIDSLGNKVIQLGEKDFNPSDSNMIYFFPKKIKYLNIKFTEDTSYNIRTSSGVKFRKAIGIKEVKVKSQKFKNEGQFISSTQTANKELSKISLHTSETLPDGFDSTLSYFLSVDNGKSWSEISPSQKVQSEIPEVLNYNIDFLEGSKKTDFPVLSTKLKLNLKIEASRKEDTKNASFKSVNKTQFVSIPQGTKSISLEEEPIKEVTITEIGLGSVGASSFYKVESSSITEFEDRIMVQLPLNIFEPESIQVDQEEIFIDNFIWERKDSLSSSNNLDKHYTFDYKNNIITFNLYDSVAEVRRGAKPIGNILLKLKREQVLFNKEHDGLYASTIFRNDGVKDQIKLYKINNDSKSKIIKLRNRASVQRLNTLEITSMTILSDPNGKMAEEVKFINGVAEFSSPGQYSLDKKTGTLYLNEEVGANEDLQIQVSYKEREEIPFEIILGNIKVKESDIKFKQKTFDISFVDSYSVDIGHSFIQKGSLEFSEVPSSVQTEIKISEMESRFNSTDQNIYAIDYKKGIIYFKEKTTGTIKGILSRGDFFVEYNIGNKIAETSYSINKKEKFIELSDSYVVLNYSESQSKGSPSKLFKIEYQYAEDVKESSSEILSYLSPMLNSYKIIAEAKESII